MKTLKKQSLRGILAFTLTSISVVAMSQDTVQLKNGTSINSKVIEISQSEIKYRKTENNDGPLYIVSKDDVKAIKYQNGSVDSFPEIKPWFRPVVKEETLAFDYVISKSPERSKIKKQGRFYIKDNNSYNERGFHALMKSYNNPEINLHIRKAALAKAFQPVCFIGIPAAAIGFPSLALSQDSFFESSSLKNFGTTLVVFSAACLTTSIILKSYRQKHNAMALRLYNQSY